jgi:aryl-alcohol dehydrogenase-like predicted oxidoreductase
VTISGPANADARAWYARTGMAIFAYSSLGRGFFSGRITRENFSEIKEFIDGACLRAYCHEVNFQRLDRAQQLAAEKGVSVAQIAMAYTLHQPLNVHALVGAASEAEIIANIEAAGLQLSSEEMGWLNLER